MNVLSSQTQAMLLCRNGSLAGKVFRIGESGIRIGSDSDNDIVIRDQSILPHHASVRWLDGKPAIYSLHTQASVTVNQDVVSPAGMYLSPGNMIGLGQLGGVFEVVADNTFSAHHMAIPPSPPESTAIIRQTSPHAAAPSQQASQTAATASQTPTETTRYLCFAARIDQGFRNYVFRHIVGEKHRAIGESHGVDLAAIVKSCYAAQKEIRIRDFVLAGLLIFLLWQHITNTLSLSGISMGSYSIIAAPLISTIVLIVAAALTIVQVAFFVLFMLLAQIKKIPVFIRVILLLLAILSLITVGPYWYLPFLIFVGAWGTILCNSWILYYGTETQQFARGKFNANTVQFPLDPGTALQLATLSDPDQNVIVYSGFLPFVGSGVDLDGWSFAIDVTKGAQKMTATLMPEPLQVRELYDCIDQAMKALKLPRLTISDKLYVHGTAISDYPIFFDALKKRPITRIDNRQMKQWMETFSEDVRYYKCMRVLSWNGELIVSIFIRFIQIEKNLFVEANYMLLPPLKEEYYLLDLLGTSSTWEKLWNLAVPSFLSTFSLWLLSPLRVLAYLFRDWSANSEQARIERLIATNPAFDYGASTSLRQEASSSAYRLHFQKLDKEMYVKIIERQLLESIIGFLDSKNIDTTDLKARQEMILNNGVIVSGGSVENLAFGEKAKAISNRSNGSANNARRTGTQHASQK